MNTMENTIQHFLSEKNPDKLSEFIGLFNPDENEIQSLYFDVLTKLKGEKKIAKKDEIQNINGFTLDETLTSILKKTGSTIFVLHKFNNKIKMLYNGYDREKECSSEFHFYNNKLFLASFSFPKLINGKRTKFFFDLLKKDYKIGNNNETFYFIDSFQNIVFIENKPILKIFYFNKNTLQSLHQ